MPLGTKLNKKFHGEIVSHRLNPLVPGVHYKAIYWKFLGDKNQEIPLVL